MVSMSSTSSAKPNKHRIKPGRVLFNLILFSLALIFLYPIYFCLISSFKDSMEIFASPFTFPTKPVFSNYPDAVITGKIGQYFINTVFLTACTLLLTVVIGSMAAYILARFVFKGKGFVYLFFVAGLMIPIQSVIIPIAYAFGKIKLYDNYPALILLFTAFSLPMTVFILTGFMKAIPVELEESAVIDGCSPRKIFQAIVIPLSMPAIASVSIFNFLQVWSNLLFPLVLIKSSNLMTISYGLLNFFAERTSDYGGVMAAGVITMTPMLVAYILLQEKVEKGLTAGAVKG